MKTDSLTQCGSYFTSIFCSIWSRRSKNYKIPKKKETITLRCGSIRKKYQCFQGFRVFNFALYPKSKTRKSRKVLFCLNVGGIWNSKSKKWPKRKNINFTMWFEKKKCQFPRFPSFRFCPILEIENLETSESFRLL